MEIDDLKRGRPFVPVMTARYLTDRFPTRLADSNATASIASSISNGCCRARGNKALRATITPIESARMMECQ
jgi:hypothetical protein